jgi:hypothetical protein
MKNLVPLLLILFILSCKNNNSHSDDDPVDLFSISYSDYKEVDLLLDYKKVSDTAYIKSGLNVTHRITELERNGKRLILFAKITYAKDEHKQIYNILDTLQINNLHKNQKVTIGYCEVENSLMEEIIAVVEKTNRDTIQKIVKAWKANDKNNKIESIENPEIVFCFNEK